MWNLKIQILKKIKDKKGNLGIYFLRYKSIWHKALK